MTALPANVVPTIALTRPNQANRRQQGASGSPPAAQKRMTMAKLIAVALALTTLLLVAPIIESETSATSQIFVTIGNADGSGGE
jgi:hypothetical protein